MYNKRAFHRHWSQNQSDNFRTCGEHPGKKVWKEKFRAAFNHPPANVKELDDKYELHLFAPGFEKSDFLIALIDQVLSISVNDKKEDKESWNRQEHVSKGFVRQFELNEKIDKSAIQAKYEDGVLLVSLRKLEGFESNRQEIKIA